MFKSLREKFGSWFGWKEGPVEQKKVKKKKTSVKKKTIKREQTIGASGVKKEKKFVKEERVVEEKKENQGFFSKFVLGITGSELKEKDFNEFFDEFETILLENNVSL